MPKATPSIFQNCAPEYVAVVLAPSTGSRLFPITSADLPKHMMPVAGIPVISRLLTAVEASGFQECVVLVASDDKVTVPHLKASLVKDDQNKDGKFEITSNKPLALESEDRLKKISILTLSEDCQGSIAALRAVEDAAVVPAASNIVVIPGDLVVFDASILSNLCDTHRQGYQGIPNGAKSTKLNSACSVLLTDSGEQDEHGLPLKESAKQKKGGLGRDEEDIEYIGLSYTSSASAPRLVLKQLKMDVHDNEGMTAETPKLTLPKPRLRVGGMTRVRTDWSDVHVYVLSPWVRRLVVERKALMTVQGDLLPLLISRQFKGVASTFGSKVEAQVVQDVIVTSPDLATTDLAGPTIDSEDTSMQKSPASKQRNEYAVLAHVQDEAVRTCSISAYLHANRQILAQACAPAGPPNDDSKKNPCLSFPAKTMVRSNFHSILLPGAVAGDKVSCKSASVGYNCKLGKKCSLKNVVIMDDVTLGVNVTLQNSIIGKGCTIGDNCSLNDCQLAPGKNLPSGEKAKGESFS